jgi:hypothetical protein
MKTSTLTVTYSLILLAIVTGLIFSPPVIAQTLDARIEYEPDTIQWDRPAPDWIYANISAKGNWDVSQIDIYTVLLEGTVPADTTEGSFWVYRRTFNCRFDGQSVINVISVKIIHMGITDPNPHRPYRIPLEITGNLTDGTPFAGTGYIAVKFPESPPEE